MGVGLSIPCVSPGRERAIRSDAASARLTPWAIAVLADRFGTC
jgi:hypothetical protein